MEKIDQKTGLEFKWVLLALIIDAVCFGIGQGNNGVALVATFIFFPLSIFLYFSPTIVAISRDHPSVTGIGVLNLFLGWTLLGWVVALVWSYSSQATPTVVIKGPRSQELDQDPADLRDCPFCAEPIRVAAIKCKHCGSDLLTDPRDFLR